MAQDLHTVPEEIESSEPIHKFIHGQGEELNSAYRFSFQGVVIDYYKSSINRWLVQDIAAASISALLLLPLAYASFMKPINQDLAMGLVFFAISSLMFYAQSARDMTVNRKADVIDALQIAKKSGNLSLISRSNAH